MRIYLPYLYIIYLYRDFFVPCSQKYREPAIFLNSFQKQAQEQTKILFLLFLEFMEQDFIKIILIPPEYLFKQYYIIFQSSGNITNRKVFFTRGCEQDYKV
jgi:hypothetical protein